MLTLLARNQKNSMSEFLKILVSESLDIQYLLGSPQDAPVRVKDSFERIYADQNFTQLISR